MKKFLALFTLATLLCGVTLPAFASDAVQPVAQAVTAAVAEAVSAAVEVAAAPTPNKGDTAWMLVATLLVIMMCIPGLALFYGGLVRSKNMLSVMMQVFSIFALIVVLWAVYGYSLAFTQGNAFIGGFDRLFLQGIYDPVTGAVANAATFSKGVVIPEFTFVAFQATFAALTVALIVGGFAERMKFSAVLLFSALWFTFGYLPIAHMVWFWPGPDAFTDAEAAAAAVLTWIAAEWLTKGKPSLLGAVSGAVAGLVAITPAAGWVGIGGGLVIGALAGVVCFWGVTGLKKLLRADDALDVFGIHAVGGILGALLTGVFNTWSMGGTGILDYVNNTIVDTAIGPQVWIQAQAVLTTVIWSGVVAFICFKIVDLTIGLRVTEEQEREGLDTALHGERAYNQ